MNYVDNVKTNISFINIEDKKTKPVNTDNSFYNGYDYGHDLYQSMEYGRKYIKNTDFGFKADLLMKRAK